MKTWQTILIAGAMIAAAIIVRVEPIVEVRAQDPEVRAQVLEPEFSKKEAKCILDNGKSVQSERMAVLIHHACEKLFP